ncbi:hypothetical protein NQ314_018189 [Rhamnusium bicolor]|uniref:DDE-1 domain-containing protein n=1 Tax=Rhamnusium bicolor TaxID=1586634 RepID=A0AAV8WRE7_9CUCU|nr:hypothetical protein NQ314_018189 [Rhamnusium bicolor]
MLYIFLPPNSTHLTQPLDVISFFKPLKVSWRKIITDYKLRNSRENVVNNVTLPTLLKRLMDNININEKNLIKKGFKDTGIYPLDKN